MDTLDLHFPFAGIDVSQAFGKQPNRPAVDGKYARTTAQAFNVRAYDSEGRARGGIRPGLVKYVSTQPGGTTFITQELQVLVTTGTPVPGGGSVQPSQSGRLVMLIAVSQGNVYVLPAGETAWVSTTNGTVNTPPLNFTGLMQSAVNNQLVFFADGTNAAYYNSADNTVHTWTLTAGIFPADTDGNLPRLICTWRGRTVMSGLLLDPSNWFMSKVSDPFDFNYAPDVPVPADSAVAGHTGPQGLTGDVITALIPYTDDILIIGQDSSISLMRGDPNYGGAIDNVTTTIGIAWGKAWCMDPSGIVYFFSNRTGVFGFIPGNQPQRISQAIDPILLQIDTGENGITMIWNDRYKSLHVFVTLLSAPMTTQHFTWESLSNAWWIDTFTNTNQNPLCCVVFDGNLPNDRVSLIGSWDGYVRSISSNATDDDGTPIQSSVMIGPFLTQYGDDVVLKDVQAIMAAGSGNVTYAVYTAETAEEALVATPYPTGTWSAGRNYSNLVRRAAHAAYIGVSSTVQWAIESVRVTIDTLGKVRQRGR